MQVPDGDQHEREHDDGDDEVVAEARQRFAQELYVLVPGNDAGAEPQAGEELKLLTLEMEGVSGTVVPAFTSLDRLEAFAPPGTGGSPLYGDVLLDMVSGAEGEVHVLLDPGHDDAALIDRSLVLLLVGVGVPAGDSSDPRADVDVSDGEGLADGEAIVGRPKEPLPEWFAQHVVRAAGEFPEIASCYEALWFIPDRHERPTPVLAVELYDADDADRVLPQLWSRIEPSASELDRPVELICLNHIDGFLEGPLAGIPPIYERDAA